MVDPSHGGGDRLVAHHDPPELGRLRPHRSETFKLSTDPLFVDKVQDIFGLYMAPPNRAIVLCVNESEPMNATGSREWANADSGTGS